MRLDSQIRQELVGFGNSIFSWLIIAKYDFKLKEIPQLLNVVEVYASSPNDKECPMLYDATDLTVRQRK